MSHKLTLEQVNALTTKQFHETFINVVECWPEAAVYVAALSPFISRETLITSFERYLQQLNIETQAKILRLHPDLAGKVATEGNLTVESKSEQESVGLNTLTRVHKAELDELNNEYKTKFGFPFVICVRENKLVTIFSEIKRRVNNSEVDEVRQGTDEVKKICRLRILEIIE